MKPEKLAEIKARADAEIPRLLPPDGDDPYLQAAMDRRDLLEALESALGRSHDKRCISLTDSEFNDSCDCRVWAMLDGAAAATERAERAEAEERRLQTLADRLRRERDEALGVVSRIKERKERMEGEYTGDPRWLTVNIRRDYDPSSGSAPVWVVYVLDLDLPIRFEQHWFERQEGPMSLTQVLDETAVRVHKHFKVYKQHLDEDGEVLPFFLALSGATNF